MARECSLEAHLGHYLAAMPAGIMPSSAWMRLQDPSAAWDVPHRDAGDSNEAENKAQPGSRCSDLRGTYEARKLLICSHALVIVQSQESRGTPE